MAKSVRSSSAYRTWRAGFGRGPRVPQADPLPKLREVEAE